MKFAKNKIAATIALFLVLTIAVTLFALPNANATTKKSSLPDFLEGYLQMQAAKANMSSAQIDQARALWIQRIALKEETIKSTNGAVLMGATSYGSWMSTFIRPETFGGGILYNQYNINGLTDGYFTRFYTPVIGSGASVVGRMSSSTSRGSIYIVAKLGPTGPGHIGNYFIVHVSNNPDASWQEWINGFAGYAQVTAPNSGPAQNLYIGQAPFTFRYISVGSVVMPDQPIPNTLDRYNDVMGDCVWTTLG